MNGIERLKRIECHCGENLTCSSRLRLHIVSELDRLIEENDRIKSNISRVLDGYNTYNPKTQKVINKPSGK